MMIRVAAFVLTVLFAQLSYAAPNPHNSLDCLFCHDEIPRFGVDTGETVGFYRYEKDDPSLCYVCHQPEENLHPVEVKPGPDSASTRPPALLPLGEADGFEGEVVCTTCHFIHASDGVYSLLRGFPGTQQPSVFKKWQDLCRQCHGEGLALRSPHSGDDRACAFCHTDRPEEGERVAVMPQGQALCNFCHGAMQGDHLKGLPFLRGDSGCMDCHNPHLGADHPGRLKKKYFDFLRGTIYVDPHGRRVLCGLCHVDEKKFTLVTRDTELLCLRCHGSGRVVGSSHPVSPIPEGMNLPEGWPVGKGRLTCLTCHLPGHLDDPPGGSLLRGGPYASRSDFCLGCHETSEEGDPHEMVKELSGCLSCHDDIPVFGRDNAQSVTFKASINVVCLRCHEDVPHPVGADHLVDIGKERAESFPSYMPLSPFRRVTCATCHNPHLSGSEKYKLREAIEGMEICRPCHGF